MRPASRATFAFHPAPRDTSRPGNPGGVAIRYLVLVTVLVYLGSQGFSSLVLDLFPRAARTRRGRVTAQVAGVAYALGVVGFEFFVRAHAPAGGGALRVPAALARGSALVLIASLLVLFVRNLLVHSYDRSRALLRALRRGDVPDAGEERAPEPPAPDAPLSRREVLARASALGIVGVTGSVAAYGGLHVARDLRVREFEAFVPDLPPELEGLTLVQITDVHVGIFTGQRDFSAVAERALALRGDLVVMTGDLLDSSPRVIPDAMAILSRVRGRLGTYAVLGNHDYYAGHAPVLAGLRGAGIRPLVNDGVLIPAGGRPDRALALLGVDDVTASRYDPTRRPDLDRAVSAVSAVAPDAPRVLLAHNPVLFETYAGRVALQLSGHTHGGQINPAGVTGLVMPFVSGRYDRAGSTLFVSNGLGCTGPPVRIAAIPEIIRIGLTGRRRGERSALSTIPRSV